MIHVQQLPPNKPLLHAIELTPSLVGAGFSPPYINSICFSLMCVTALNKIF